MTEAEFLAGVGLIVDSVVADGALHRVPTREKPKKKNGWYIAHAYPRRVIIAGDWQKPSDRQFWSADGKGASKKEQKHFELLLQAQRKADQEKRAADFLSAVAATKSIIERGSTVTDHRYLSAKKLAGTFLADGDQLIFPLTNQAGDIMGAQRILSDGQKFFIKGTRKQGSFYCLDGQKSRVYICEGIATGLTINNVTGFQTYCALDCGNLKSIVVMAALRHKGAVICIAADDDQWTEENAGVKAAVSARDAAPGSVIMVPKFSNTASQPTDFNDLYCIDGPAAALTQLTPSAETKTAQVIVPPGKVPYENIVEETLKAMRREETSFPKFPVKLHIKSDLRGERIILVEESNQIIRVVSDQFVLTAISQYFLNNEFCYTYSSGDTVSTDAPRKLSAKSTHAIFSLWFNQCENFPHEISTIKLADEPSYAFNRVPFLFEPGPTPTWDALMKRASDPTALMAFIGSLFVPNSDRSQYCWMFGEGGDGKGSTQRFLKRIMGSAYKAMTTDHINQFWSSQLIGKRLADFGDCNNFQFITTGLFKQITGGDAIPMEFKNKNGFDSELNCKVMFSSNDKPNISRKRSDLRRAIFISFRPLDIKDYLPAEIYESKLWSERAAFLNNCMTVYRKVCPQYGTIPVKQEMLSDLVSLNEERWEVIASRYFKFHKPDPNKIARDLNHVSVSQVHGAMDKEKLTYLERRNFISYLRQYGVESKMVKLGDGTLARRYVNASWHYSGNFGDLPSDYMSDDIDNIPFD